MLGKMSMKLLHDNIIAARLRHLFSSSPLILVYQTLGQVDVNAVKQSLQSGIEKQQPGSGARRQFSTPHTSRSTAPAAFTT